MKILFYISGDILTCANSIKIQYYQHICFYRTSQRLMIATILKQFHLGSVPEYLMKFYCQVTNPMNKMHLQINAAQLDH